MAIGVFEATFGTPDFDLPDQNPGFGLEAARLSLKSLVYLRKRAQPSEELPGSHQNLKIGDPKGSILIHFGVLSWLRVNFRGSGMVGSCQQKFCTKTRKIDVLEYFGLRGRVMTSCELGTAKSLTCWVRSGLLISEYGGFRLRHCIRFGIR